MDNIDYNRKIWENYTPPKAAFKRHTIAYNMLSEKITNILEVGCASDSFLKLFPDNVEKYGVDLVERKLGGIRFKQFDIERGLPYSDNYFDAIYGGEIIEHLLDTDLFLRECHRILKNRGILILSTPNSSALVNLVKWIKKEQFYGIGYNFESSMGGHLRFYAIKSLRKQLEEHNFKIEKVITLYSNGLPGKILQFLFRMRGGHIIVKARKV